MEKKRTLSVLAGCVLTTLLIFSTFSPSFAAVKYEIPWEGKIRPGVASGNNDNPTDFFFDFFLPVWGTKDNVLFFNPIVRWGDNDSNELNVGLGFRQLLMNDGLILGGSFYYDAMNSENDNHYDQLGIGFEALSKWLDFHANYYHPIGDTENRINSMDVYSFGSTSLLVNRGFEEALKGFDTEVGVLLPYISNYMETRLSVGYYWYDSDNLSGLMDGSRFRLEVRPVELVSLQLETKNDDLGSSTYIGGYLEIPFSLGALFSGKNPFVRFKETLAFGKGARRLRKRMSDKVIRDRHIVAPAFNEDEPTAYADMIYVNADNLNAGTGALEDPYQNASSVMANARYKDGTWVHVFSSDDTADIHNVNLTLLPRMVLWGEGAGFKNIAPGGPHPILDGGGGGGDVVTLANNNEVMGLQIQNGGYGIKGDITTAGQSISHKIHHNKIMNNPVGGIYIENEINDPTRLAGVGITNRIYNNTITSNGTDGVYLDNFIQAPDMQGVYVNNWFSQNTISGSADDGVELYNHLYAFKNTPGSDVAANISASSIQNTFSGNMITANSGSGVVFQSNELYAEANYSAAALTGNVTADVTGSTITNTFSANTIGSNLSHGIEITKNRADAYAKSDGITVSGSVKSGVTGLVFRNILTENVLMGNSGDGVYINDSSVYARTYAYNTSSPIGGDATAAVSGTSFLYSVTGNQISNNDDGFYVTANKTVAYAEADNADVTGGVSASVSASPLTYTFSGNDILSNTNDGVYIVSGLHADAYAYGTISPTSVGQDLKASITGSAVSTNFSSNTLTGNRDGVNIAGTDTIAIARADHGSGVTGDVSGLIRNDPITNTFSQNDILANRRYGVYINNDPEVYASADNAATASNLSALISASDTTNTFSDNSIANNVSHNVYLEYNRLYSEAKLDNGAVVAGSVSGGIENSHIRNIFTRNDFSNSGSDDGVNIRYNYLHAFAYADNGSTVGTDMTASIDRSDSISTFTSNTIDNNNDYGVYLEDFQVTAESKAQNGSDINGNLVAAVEHAPITFAFNGNDISGNSKQGVYFKELIATRAYGWAESGSTVGGNMSASLAASDMASAFTSNTISGNTNGGGVYFAKGYLADAGAPIDSASVDGNVTADIADTTMTYTFSDNRLIGNNGPGVYISGNKMTFSNRAETANIGGDMSGSVSDSAITLTLERNTIQANQGDGFELVTSNFVGSNRSLPYLFNLDGSSILGSATATVMNTPITNTFKNNDISYNQGNSYGINMTTPGDIEARIISDIRAAAAPAVVTGDIAASVDASPITNHFSNNTIDLNTDDGIYIGSNKTTGYIVLAKGGTAGGNVSGSIDNSPISNTFSNNDIFGNQGHGILFNSTNLLEASAEVNGAAASAGGNISGRVNDSSVVNTFSGNTIKSNNDYGIYFQAGNKIKAYGFLANGATAGNVSGAVSGSPMTNTFASNDVSSNGATGIYLAGNVTEAYGKAVGTVNGSVAGSVSASPITNTFTDNVVSFNVSRGIYVQNELKAYTDLDNAAVTGSVTASVTDSIGNSFMGNTVSLNRAGDGIYVDSQLHADALFSGSSSTVGSLTVGVDGSKIANTFSANTVSNNTGLGINITRSALFAVLNDSAGTTVTGNAQVSVTGSRVLNSLSSNQINGNNTAGGVYLGNALYADAGFSGSVGGNLSVFVNPSGIENDFSENQIGLNDSDGVYVDNEMYARWTGGTVTGSADASLIDSTISDHFWKDSITGNAGDGVYIESDTSNTTNSQDVTLKLFMQRVSLLHNNGYGLNAIYSDAGVFTGDLGGGAIGSAGGNTFFGSGIEDVFNNTGVTIKARYNWWGDIYPADQVGGADPVDFVPPLTSAP